ncbi:MAG: ATP-binding protein [Cyanobacteriota bacterium]|nr:ATP-binding protein [Cyanobacteriota bacterium]
MAISNLAPLRLKAASLLLYQDLWQTPLGQAWLKLLEICDQPDNLIAIRRAYGLWFRALAETQLSWQEWLFQQILWADNPFSRRASQQPFHQLPLPLQKAAAEDLAHLREIAIGSASLRTHLQSLAIPVESWWDPLTPMADPLWQAWQQAEDCSQILPQLADRYRQEGVGLWARYRAFRWQSHQLVGVAQTDRVPIDDLYGNLKQKQRLCANTEALLSGKPALHVLLYGARGTGKSSLVKALLTRYGDAGLRLLELSPAQLLDLPQILPQLQQQPQAFILFVDDLSFEAEEREFKQLKVLLEGDIAAQPANVRLYATTNRRHLIREYVADRPNPSDQEIHAWDTLQEKMSLRDRFGLTLTFTPFRQTDYLSTVDHLMANRGLSGQQEIVQRQALMWAQQQNGFSGRTARQFVDAWQAGLL